MMKVLLFSLLFWKMYLAEANATLYQADNNEDFYSFVIRNNEIVKEGLLQDLFNNLVSDNSIDKCTKDLKNYRDSIDNQEQWAISLLDSSGLSFTGLLSGNTINFGNYKQCISTSPKKFNSSYCTVEFSISNKPNGMLPWVPHDVPVVLSLCLPDSCSSKQLRSLLEPSTSENNATVTVQCQSRRPEFTYGDFSAMFLYILVWIVIISTTLPKKWIPIKNDVFHQVWDSFSLHRNLATLLKTNSTSAPLSSLHGLRVISQCMIVWLHIVKLEVSENFPITNKFSTKEFLRSWQGVIVINWALAVDTFFVIGGLLVTWNWLEKKRKFNLVSYYIHRYLRLTPPYIATIILTSTFVYKLSDGPLINSFIDNDKRNCVSYWWTNLLYINNFYPGLEKCMAHCWYLSADWQLFFFISPFVVMVINKWPQHLYKLIIAILLLSVTTTFLISYLHHLPTAIIFSKDKEHLDYFNKLYVTPYWRAGPWAIGMLCGVFLHNFKNDKMELSKATHLIAWLLTLIGLCLSFELVLPLLRMQGEQNSVWAALYNTIQPNLFAASIGWIIFSSETQKAGFIGKFLSWPVFQPLAKLSYSAYLIHYVIVQLYIAEAYGYNNISIATQIPIALGITLLAYLAATLLYLSFEAPITRLDNILIKKETTGNKFRKGTEGNNSTPEIKQL